MVSGRDVLARFREDAHKQLGSKGGNRKRTDAPVGSTRLDVE